VEIEMQDREPSFHELISEWIPWWDESKLPYISVQEIGRAPAMEWVSGIEEEWSPAVWAAMQAAQETPEAEMVRWDHCSGNYLKYFMDRGRPFLHERGTIPYSLDDMRFFEMTMDFAHRHGDDADLIMWRRPWVRAVDVDGYPLEFRVFVLDGSIRGVSSYYPQRPLPETFVGDAQRAWDMTEVLVDVGPPDFTCDWLVRDDDRELIIIECGPPHIVEMPWADPCCFPPGQIEGIALRPLPGSDAERINSSRDGGTTLDWDEIDD
jgi:hypothetical protein